MIAKQKLPVGTCLFVIPPTVRASPDKVLQRSKEIAPNDTDDNAPAALERLADDILLQEMQSSLNKAKESSSITDIATANSFLVLEGDADADNKNNDIPSMNCLLAADNAQLLLEQGHTEDNLRQIIRRNAFGPDFMDDCLNATSIIVESSD